MDRTPFHNTHLCSTVCSQARNALHALGSSHTDCGVIFVRLRRICHLVRTCLTLCCSLACRLPRAHLPHSLFLLPRHQNTQHNRDNTTISKYTQGIMNFSRLSQSTSRAIRRENLPSGGNPRKTTPAGYEAKELATVSRTEDYPGDPYQFF